jgi:tetratricopeptide (TPR) repeat protein
VAEIKSEANKLFAKKEYLKAIEYYDEAGRLLPEGAVEKADLLCNKAACYYQMKRCVQLCSICSCSSNCLRWIRGNLVPI